MPTDKKLVKREVKTNPNVGLLGVGGVLWVFGRGNKKEKKNCQGDFVRKKTNPKGRGSPHSHKVTNLGTNNTEPFSRKGNQGGGGWGFWVFIQRAPGKRNN